MGKSSCRWWGKVVVVHHILDLTAAEFRSLLDHTVTGPFVVSQAALKRFFLPQQRGVIVFLGSLCEEWGAWGQVGYSAGKAALGPVCKHLLALCGRSGVRAHVVRPAVIETRSRNALKRLSQDARWYEKEGRLFPQGRVAKPADIAALIGWLVSPQAACVGAEITADFGLKAVGLMHPDWSPLAFRESFVASVTQHEEAARKAA